MIANQVLLLAAQDRLAMAVVLELKPVVAWVLQEKGLMLQHLACETHFGAHGKGLTGLFHPHPQGVPRSCLLKDQTEMARLNPLLWWPQFIAVALQHQLVAA